MKGIEKTLTSLEVAEMVGREHRHVIRDIRTIIGQLAGQPKSVQSYFFESTYTNSQNREMPMFRLTKKGCELYATRMTGEKGTQFAVAYIEKFNEIEQHIKQLPQMSQAELIAMIAQQGVEQEHRLLAVEKKQDDIKEIFTVNTHNWRKEVNNIINKIAFDNGGKYQSVRQKSYSDLEIRASVNLERRLSNMVNRAKLAGASKKEVSNLNYLDVIERDEKLVEIYLTIVKEMALKYGIDKE